MLTDSATDTDVSHFSIHHTNGQLVFIVFASVFSETLSSNEGFVYFPAGFLI